MAAAFWRAAARLRSQFPCARRIPSFPFCTDGDGFQSSRVKIFDRDLKRKQRDRAAWLMKGNDEFVDSVAENLLDRLEDCKKTFPDALCLGGSLGAVRHLLRDRGGIEKLMLMDMSIDMIRRLKGSDNIIATGKFETSFIVGDEEYLPIKESSVDLVISCLGLHWTNDLPGSMIQCRLALKPDGLFLAAILGGETLKELRTACTIAHMEREGGISPRMSPLAQVRDAGNLLTRAGFSLPSVDVDEYTVRYNSALDLIEHLRAMGETNSLLQRRNLLKSETALATAAVYESMFAEEDGTVPATFQVPDYPMLRQNLLHLAQRVARLPEDVKKDLEDPESRYNFGWSHGKERLESGKLDILKGSFYANPILDNPTTDISAIERYPAYCRANKWPTVALPELEGAFKELGNLMLNVGLVLAYHCDVYVSKDIKALEAFSLEHILKKSRCHKGRLLHYFPRWHSDEKFNGSMSSWCGWHTDHGSLTALTSGIFTRNDVEVVCPDRDAGLYVKTRNHQVVKVVFGVDELAYQIGETTEILSRGLLCATPHCVQAPKGEEALGVERSTFAFFMQPDWDESLQFPPEVLHHKELIPPNGKLTFGEFSETLISKYYLQQS